MCIVCPSWLREEILFTFNNGLKIESSIFNTGTIVKKIFSISLAFESTAKWNLTNLVQPSKGADLITMQTVLATQNLNYWFFG